MRVGGAVVRRLVGRALQQSPQHAEIHDRRGRLRDVPDNLLHYSLHERRH